MTLVGNQLTITPGSGNVGVFVVTVSVGDGANTVGRSFRVATAPK